MHIPIERLHEFVRGLSNLTGSEQAHLVHCGVCVDWLDACAMEKLSYLMNWRRQKVNVFFGENEFGGNPIEEVDGLNG
jgi:hypothetical protein